MLKKDNIEIIYPKIMVFRNGVPNPEEIVKRLSEYKDWDKWYDIGEQILINPFMYLRFEEFPSSEEWLTEINNNQQANIDKGRRDNKELSDIIDNFERIFFEATDHYINHYNDNTTIQNWVHSGSNLLRYEGRSAAEYELTEEKTNNNDGDKYDTTKGKAGGNKQMTLPFHTDFYQRDADVPGLKAEYTITMYLNDDYDGGEIDFRIFDRGENDMRIVGDRLVPIDENYGEIPEIAYKPQAGDVIIFPSRPPFYHGVRRVLTGTKYFARMFWMSRLD